MEPLAKTLVIGVDGGEPTLFDQWSEAGDLPNFDRLRARGTTGRTRNPTGLEAGAVWPSFHTGLSPGRQPQYDGLRHFDSELYNNRWYEADEVMPHLWRTLSDQNRRVLVIDAPYARLDHNLDGAMIVDWGSHVPSDGQHMQFQTHPASLLEEVLEVVGPDPTAGVTCDRRKLESTDDFVAFVEDYLDRLEKKGQLTVHMLNKGGWDFAEVVFTDLHCVGHHTWHINDPTHPKYTPRLENALGEPLRRVYRAFDEALGEILDVIDERTTNVILLMSHGMGPQYTGTGLLDRMLDRLASRGTKRSKRESLTPKARLLGIWHMVPGDVRARVRPLRGPFKGALTVKQFLPDPQSRPYFEVYANNMTGGVRINLEGREVHGVVSPEAYDLVLETLSGQLKTFTNRETGEPLVEDCVFTREIYGGEYLDRLPDMLVSWNRSAPIRVVESPLTGPLRQNYAGFRTGDHTPFGMFVAAGPQFEPMTLSDDVASVDFAPTIAALLGAEIGPTDGTPIPGLGGAATPFTST